MTKEKTEIYITKIDDDNKENFNALMSDYTYGCLDLYGYHGIGALIETTDGFLPVGVLIFSQEMFTIEDDTDEPFLNITWLYVDEQYRKTGIADKLILKFFQVAEAVSIDTRMVDIPLASQFDELVGVFEKWNFKFILADNPFIVFTKDNIAAWKNIKNPSKDLPVIDLEKLPAEKFKEYINNLNDAEYGMLSDDKESYDMNKSLCVYIDKEIHGCLLVTKVSEEHYNMDYIGADSEYKTSGILSLLKEMAYIPEEAQGDLNLHFQVPIGALEEPFEKFIPENYLHPLRRGVQISGIEFDDEEEDDFTYPESENPGESDFLDDDFGLGNADSYLEEEDVDL